PAGVDIAHDQLIDGIEGAVAGRIIMHREHDAGNDLDRKEDSGRDSEIPEIVEVARHRIAAADGAVGDARKRQALVEPAPKGGLRLVGSGPGKTHARSTPSLRSRPWSGP